MAIKQSNQRENKSLLPYTFFLGTSPGHRADSEIQTLCFSADDTLLLSGAEDYSAKLYDLEKCDFTHDFNDFKSFVEKSIFTKEQPEILAFVRGHRMERISLESAEVSLLFDVQENLDYVPYALSADGKYSISKTHDDRFLIMNIEERREYRRLEQLSIEGSWAVQVDISRDHRFVAACYSNGTIALWNVESGDLIRTIQAKSKDFVSFTHNSDHLISGSGYKKVKLWSIKTGELLKEISFPSSLNSFALGSDGLMAAAGKGGDIYLFSLDRKPEILLSTYQKVTALSLSHKGEYTAIGFEKGDIIVVENSSGQTMHHLEANHSFPYSLFYDSVNQILFTGSSDGKLMAINYLEGTVAAPEINFNSRWIKQHCSNENGTVLLAYDFNGFLMVIDRTSGQVLSEHQLHGDFYALSPDEKYLFSCSEEGLQCFDFKSMELAWHCNPSDLEGGFNSVEVLSDNQRIVAFNRDFGLYILDLKTGNLQKRFKSSQFSSIAADGSNILLCQGDSVYLYNVESDSVEFLFYWEDVSLDQAAFSRDGRYIALGDHELIVWDRQDKMGYGPVKNNRDITDISFIDEEKVALTKRSGHLMVWSFKQALPLDSTDLDDPSFLTCSFYSDKNYELFEIFASKTLARGTDNLYFFSTLLKYSLDQGDPIDEQILSVLEVESNDIDCWISLGDTLYKRERFKDALGIYKKAVNLDSTHEEANFSLALCYFQLDEYEKSLELLERKIQRTTYFHHSLSLQGNMYGRLGKYKECFLKYQETLRVDPKNGGNWYNMACYMALAGKGSEALEALKKAVQNDKKFKKLAKNDSDFDSIRERVKKEFSPKRAKPITDLNSKDTFQISNRLIEKKEAIALYGAGFLNFLPEVDLTEEQCLSVMLELTEQFKPYSSFIEVIGSRVARFSYAQNMASYTWLDKDEAEAILTVYQDLQGTTEETLLEFISFETMIPEDGVDNKPVYINLPKGNTFRTECSYMLMDKDRIQWINDDLTAGESSVKGPHSPEELLVFHRKLMEMMNRCAEVEMVFCIR